MIVQWNYNASRTASQHRFTSASVTTNGVRTTTRFPVFPSMMRRAFASCHNRSAMPSVIIVVFIGSYHPLLGLIALVAYALIGVAVPMAIAKNSRSIGAVRLSGVVIPVIALMSSFGPAIALANLGGGLQSTFAAGNRVLDILDEEPAVREVTDGTDITFTGAACDKVNFAYEQEQILHDFSLKVTKNHVIGLMGKSGSGKSTILKLLMRFWDIGSGKVTISGTAIHQINTASLRNCESFVTQDTQLFHDSIERMERSSLPPAGDGLTPSEAGITGIMTASPSWWRSILTPMRSSCLSMDTRSGNKKPSAAKRCFIPFMSRAS